MVYNGTDAIEGRSPIQIPVTSLKDPENPQYTIHGLSDNESYFFVISAYDTAGNESGFSNELSYTPTSSTPENTIPKVTITAPADGSSFNQYDSITFRGSAIDAEDGNISNRLSWASNIDGAIGSGAALTTSALSAGKHTITVSAKDSSNLSGTATITLTVLSSTTSSAVIDNDDPGTSSTGSWPLSSGANYYGTQSRYSTTVNGKYTYDVPLTGSYGVYLWWTTRPNRCSAVPVEIYDDTTLLDTVTVNHQVDGGQWNPIGLGAYTFTGQAKVSIVSTAAGRCSTSADAVKFVSSSTPENTAPKVTITAPASGSSFKRYDSITFRGSAVDAEDGNISNSLSWVSNIDGAIGSGATLTTSVLSAGTHTITVSAKDSGNLSGTATITLTVLSSAEDNPLEVTITATDYAVMPDLRAGDLYYLDRSYILTSIPSDFVSAGEEWIMTRNDDKNKSSASFLQFNISQNSTVYVAYDSRVTSLPNWLNSFTPSSLTVGVSDSGMDHFNVYEKTFSPGTVVLGGNNASGANGVYSNYIVIVKKN